MNTASKPDFIAHHVRASGQNSFWDRVGAAFAHKDGQGFDVVLDSLPVGGRVVLRVPSDKPEADQ